MQWFSTYVYYIKIKCMEESGGSCLHDVLMNDASLTFDLRSWSFVILYCLSVRGCLVEGIWLVMTYFLLPFIFTSPFFSLWGSWNIDIFGNIFSFRLLVLTGVGPFYLTLFLSSPKFLGHIFNVSSKIQKRRKYVVGFNVGTGLSIYMNPLKFKISFGNFPFLALGLYPLCAAFRALLICFIWIWRSLEFFSFYISDTSYFIKLNVLASM